MNEFVFVGVWCVGAWGGFGWTFFCFLSQLYLLECGSRVVSSRLFAFITMVYWLVET